MLSWFTELAMVACLLHSAILSRLKTQRRKGHAVSSLALLNSDGVVARKLQLVSLPSDYVIPDGMIVSWKTELHTSSSDPFVGWNGPPEPAEAFFYLGNAQGQVCRNGFRESERDNQHRLRFGPRDLIVTVQGTSATDVMRLRDRILHLIQSGARWDVSNDLNPKPKKSLLLLQRIKKMVGIAKK